MLLAFDESLTEQRIVAHGAELASVLGRDRDAAGNPVTSYPDALTAEVAVISAPVLMTDYHRIAQLAPTLRDTVCKLYESPLRATSYRGTRLDFEQRRYPGTWGPNIDTLLVCRALPPERLRGVRRAVEIGSGSGFISKYLLEHAPDLEELTLVDIQPDAIECGRENVVDPRARYVAGDGLRFLDGDGTGQGKRFDLIVCNPPYIPRPGSLGGNAYEGIGLLAHFIERGEQHLLPGGRIVSVISSVSESVVRPLIDRRGVRCEVLDELNVPLKVLGVLNNPEWMQYLLSQKGLRPVWREGYDYWHTVRVCGLHGAG